MRLTEVSVASVAAWILITPTMAAEDWQAEAKKWEAEAKKWEAIAKIYEDQYGWINEQFSWCSLNRDVSTFLGYSGPDCLRPFEPFCAALRNCSEWEIEDYKSNVNRWIECRREYIREAQDDAGCALLKIREGIDAAIEGRH